MKELSNDYHKYITDIFPEILKKKKTNNYIAATITFQVTQDCNFACSYCYEINKCSHMMTWETAKKYIDDLLENRQNTNAYINEIDKPVLVIEFFGGEPTLNMPLINKITDYFERWFTEHPDCPWTLFHRYNICSNGWSYFTDEVQEYIAKYHDLVCFSITVDGCKEMHDECRLTKTDKLPTYDRAISAALDRLHKYGELNTKITLAPSNVHYIYQAITNMIELGFYDIHINCAFEEGWETVNAIEIYEQYKKVADYIKANNLYEFIYVAMLRSDIYHNYLEEDLNKCYCGTSGCMTNVDPDGNICTCVRFNEISLGKDTKPYFIGHVDHGIGYTDEEKDHIKNITEKTTTRHQSTEECINCPIGHSCSYCTAYNYQRFGEFKRATFICECTIAAACATKYLCKIVKDKKGFDENMITKELALRVISEDEWNLISTYED